MTTATRKPTARKPAPIVAPFMPSAWASWVAVVRPDRADVAVCRTRAKFDAACERATGHREPGVSIVVSYYFAPMTPAEMAADLRKTLGRPFAGSDLPINAVVCR